MSARDGGPAFPHWHTTVQPVSGMSLRDKFADSALAGILANPEWLTRGDFSAAGVARSAWEYADAMLAARGDA